MPVVQGHGPFFQSSILEIPGKRKQTSFVIFWAGVHADVKTWNVIKLD